MQQSALATVGRGTGCTAAAGTPSTGNDDDVGVPFNTRLTSLWQPFSVSKCQRQGLPIKEKREVVQVLVSGATIDRYTAVLADLIS
jgi:hypothetical protein